MMSGHVEASTISATLLSLLLLTSGISIRIQTICGPGPEWLSTFGDDTSLGKLALLADGKTTPELDSLFVKLEPKVRVYIASDTKKRCHGGDVFLKIHVMDGGLAQTEGWVCGNSITRRRIWMWRAL